MSVPKIYNAKGYIKPLTSQDELNQLIQKSQRGEKQYVIAFNGKQYDPEAFNKLNYFKSK